MKRIYALLIVFLILTISACSSLETAKKEATLCYEHGNTNYAIGKYEEAIKDYTKAIELNQNTLRRIIGAGCLFQKEVL